ncbi:MAG: nucleoside-diphosphate sugar epimerase [Anaerolineaceae bacterium 4572_5.2]|nr:MAG: nucleoside-diphosphate sugar epimerase [Anaerolineaceae bacterium 4572_5.2]
MRILITGSSGQIGSNLGLHLQQQGHQIFGIDKRSNTWTDQIETVIQDLSIPYKNFSGGIGNISCPDNPDVVVHLAANAKVHELVEQPDRALENIIMTYNALEFCRQNKLPLIFSSSRETYGNLRHNQETTSEGMADFSLAASPYAASKVSGEASIYSYSRCYDIPYLIFRFSNVYGRFDNDIERMERVIPLFIHKIGRGEPVTIYGKDKVLDFTYIDDCVSGIAGGIKALVSGRVVNQTINLAYGRGNSLVAMTEFISEALEMDADVSIEPSLRGEVTNYIADISKAKALLGYNPATALREGIFKSVAWSKEWEKRANI